MKDLVEPRALLGLLGTPPEVGAGLHHRLREVVGRAGKLPASGQVAMYVAPRRRLKLLPQHMLILDERSSQIEGDGQETSHRCSVAACEGWRTSGGALAEGGSRSAR